jgi:hypothetical protein
MSETEESPEKSPEKPGTWIKKGSFKTLNERIWNKEILPLWKLSLNTMSPEKAQKADIWTLKIADHFSEFPLGLLRTWLPIWAYILASLKVEHRPLLERMWSWLDVALLPIIARFSADGQFLCIPTPIELRHAMGLFMFLVTNGDFAPLVNRPTYIKIRPGSFPSIQEAKQQREPNMIVIGKKLAKDILLKWSYEYSKQQRN